MESQLEGRQIGRYLVHQRLGGGGVATVYQAFDQVAGHLVALKVLPPNPDPATLNRFRREALKAGGLHHPNIVRILQVGTAADGESAYIAMDLVEGESMASLLNRFGQLSAEESCRLLEPIARALAYAHSQGVIHRDVKPSNILLRSLTEPRSATADQGVVQLQELPYPVVPLLSDFGIARFLDQDGIDLTFTGQTVGTPAFMAPEQCMGSREIDGRADIYALGIVLYRSVVGHLPFSGSTTQILHAQVFEPVVLGDEIMRSLPPRVVEMLTRALAKAPEHRYQSAGDFTNDLAQVGRGAPKNKAATAFVHDEHAYDEPNAGSTMTMAQFPTATKTMAQLPGATQPVSTRVKVLVPGTTSAALVSRGATVSESKKRKREPRIVTVLWALLFVFLIGALIWNIRTWYARQSEEDSRASLVPLRMVTFTPTAGPPSTQSNQDAPVATLTPALPAAVVTIAVAATSVPTATPSPLPTATEPPIPTELPTLAPTEAPAVVEVATPTGAPPSEPTSEPTAVGNPETTSSDAVAGICLTVADEFFLLKIQALPSDQQAEFACPTKAIQSVAGDWLSFEHGAMIAIDGAPLVYVYYENGSWEQVPINEPHRAERAPDEGGARGREGIPQPFAHILASQGRAILLGEPTEEKPVRAETLIQPFNGGMILGDKERGHILLLARSKLRF